MVKSHEDGVNRIDIEESVIAKSTGQQEEENVAIKDAALYRVLNSKKKMTKHEAGYREQEKHEMKTTNYNYDYDSDHHTHACIKCKFNLPDEKNCHIVEGEINNGYGMLSGDIVWDFIKKTGKKLEYEEGHVMTRLQRDSNAKTVNITCTIIDVC